MTTEKLEVVKEEKFSILGLNNAKTVKGEKEGYLTGIVYLFPNAVLCENAKIADCAKTCIVHTGYALVYPGINGTRKKRSVLFLSDKVKFFEQLEDEICKFIKKAKKMGLKPVLRLNGTSDILYEDIIVRDNKNIFELYPDVQFYDYTKVTRRLFKQLPPNYDLTFSYSNAEEYQKQVTKAMTTKTRMAVVFKNGLPDTFLGKKVIDGDKNDLRFLEPSDVIVGLIAKGKAKKGNNSFVVDTKKL